MNKPPNSVLRLGALAAIGLSLGACRGPEASVGSSNLDPPPKLALTPEQARELGRLEPLLRRSSRGLSGTVDADGRQGLDLGGGFQHAMMVQKNPDGTHSFICTDSIEQATEFFTRSPGLNVEEE